MKAKFGAVVVDGRGKIGGHVASKNRSGSYFRTKVTPVNPRSVDQGISRSRLSTYAQAWRGLTEAQRAAWNAAVKDFSKTNIFGDLVSPTGLNLYVKLNVNLAIAGGAALTEPPAVSEVSTVFLDSISFTAAPDGIELNILAPVPANTAMVVRMTEGFSQGISFFSNKLRVITVVAPAQASPVALTNPYVTKFGSLPAEGLKIAAEVYFINRLTGQASAVQRVSAIVLYA